jgi:nucleotide-binding universal stress UspA family protein
MQFSETAPKFFVDHGTRPCSGPSSTAERDADEVGMMTSEDIGGGSGAIRAARVVVGVDGSSSALAAVTWAAAEAARRDGELHLVEVLPASDAAGLAGGRPQGRARALLYRAAETARAVSPTVPVSTTALSGKVGPSLLSQATGAELLVVGSNGPGGPIPLSVGRVLGEVTGRAGCPAVVVPGRRTGLSSTSGAVLVAVDGDTESEGALAFAADTALRWGKPLIVLDPRNTGTHLGGERYPGLVVRSAAEESVDAVMRADDSIRLVVLGTLRRSATAGGVPGWNRHFLPLYCPCPVAVVPPHAWPVADGLTRRPEHAGSP